MRQVIKAQLGTDLNLQQGAVVETRKLPMVHPMRALHLILTGVLNVAGGAADGTLTEFGILNILKRIALVVNNKEHKVFSGPMLSLVKNLLENQVANLLTQPAVGVGANAFRAELTIPFAQEDMVRGEQFQLPTGISSAPGVKMIQDLTFGYLGGVVADVITGGDRTNTLVSVNLEVEVEIDTAHRDARWYRKLREVEREEIIPTSVSPEEGREIELGRTAIAIRRLFFLARDNSVVNNALITRLRLEADDVESMDSEFLKLQTSARKRFGIAMPTGGAARDFDERGLLDRLPTMQGATRAIIFAHHIAATGVGTLRFVAQEILR